MIDGLRSRGHTVELLSGYGHSSSVQLLEVLSNGVYAFGSDPRCEGQAIGLWN